MKFKKYTEKEQLEMVKENSWAMEYIKNPSEEVQLAAVNKNGLALQYIQNPSLEVQIEAVKQNGWVLTYIPEFNEKIYQVAKKHDYMQNKGVFIEYEKLRPKKVVEHTMEELSEILGYEVKIKKESRGNE